jgi:hypothetical protein
MYTLDRKWIAGLLAAVSMALVGCGDDEPSQPDGGRPDAGLPDAGAPDGGPTDGGAGDAGVCPSPEELWEDIDLAEFTALPALEELDTEGTFTLAESATYWELRRGAPGSEEYQVVLSVGDKCVDAGNAEVCRNEFDAMTAQSGFGPSCLPGQCFNYIAVNRGDTSSLVITREELVTFLGTIDSSSEAALIAFSHGYLWDASEPSAGSARVSEEGFELLVTELVQACLPIQTDRVQVQVSPAGALTVTRQQVFRVNCGACA